MRFVVVVDAGDLDSWVGATLERLRAAPQALIVGVLSSRRSESQGPLQTPLSDPLAAGWLPRIYERLERRLYPAVPDAFSTLHPTCPDDHHVPSEPRDEATPAAVADGIRRTSANIVLWLARREPDPLELESAPDTWVFQTGDGDFFPGPRAAFWEVLDRSSTTTVRLVSLRAGRNVVSLAETTLGTDDCSTLRNRSAAGWKCALLVTRAIARQKGQRGPTECRSADDASLASVIPRVQGSRSEGLNARLVRHGSRRLKNMAQKRLGRFEWFLRTAPWREDLTFDAAECSRLYPPRDRFWADPFIVAAENCYHIFVEEFPYAAGKGHIAVLTLDQEGRLADNVVVLEEDCHLAYPFVFEWSGEWFMVPDSAQRNSVVLYRALEFPHRWEQVATLLSGVSAVDSTLVRHEGLWWLFTSIDEASASLWDELSVFHAERLDDTTWTPHPLNPVISDARCARPAGRLFSLGGQLHRPSQDCSVTYGYGIRISRVDRLTPADYHESEVAFWEPEPNGHLLGMHTLTLDGGLMVTDARRWRPHWSRRS